MGFPAAKKLFAGRKISLGQPPLLRYQEILPDIPRKGTKIWHPATASLFEGWSWQRGVTVWASTDCCRNIDCKNSDAVTGALPVESSSLRLDLQG
jgi:hypothetical protein